MKHFQRVTAVLLAFILIFALASCGKDEDDTKSTTKKKTSATTTSPAIDIWAYLNGEGATADANDTAGTATLPSGSTGSKSSGKTSSGNYTYEDLDVNFGSSTVFSSATTNSYGYPTFHWNAVSGAIRYNVYRAISKNGTYGFLDSTTATSYTDKTAVKGTNYFYKVKAVKLATTAATKSTTKAASAATTAAPQTTRNTANAPSVAPKTFSTVSEIVNFYNTCANRVKTSASSVTRNFRTIKYIDDPNNSDTAKTLLALAGVKENTDSNPQTYTSQADIIAQYPVEGASFSSALTTDMVAKAGCSYSNGYYNVIIILKDDPAKTTDYSETCVNVIRASSYYSGATSETRGTEIQAKIYYDGSLDYLDQYVPTWVYIKSEQNDVAIDAQVALSVEEFWSATY